MHSGLPDPERPRERGALPREALPVVRLGRDEEGLELAAQLDGVRPPLFEGDRRGDRESASARAAVEGKGTLLHTYEVEADGVHAWML